MLYALNLDFDPADSSGQFQPANTSAQNGRAWWSSANNGATWTYLGDPDSVTPSLSPGDQVQFSVRPVNSASPAVQSAAVTVLFAKNQTQPNNPARIASPFQYASGPLRCLFQDSPNGNGSWRYIGPYTVQVNSNNSGKGKLKFEFSLVAHVSFSDNSVKDYGYDPEMDVDIPN